MSTPKVVAIHDMSGFGRCSLTVAIPVLSAAYRLAVYPYRGIYRVHFSGYDRGDEEGSRSLAVSWPDL